MIPTPDEFEHALLGALIASAIVGGIIGWLASALIG
jgi:Flp pilus assembly pilin Flp